MNCHPEDQRLSNLIAGIRAGVSPVCDVATPQGDEFGVLTLAAVTSGRIHPSAAKRIASARVQPEWPVVRRGTVLVTRASGSRKLVGACALVEKDEPRLIVPDTVWVLELAEGRSGRALVEFLRSSHGRKAIHKIMRGSTGIWKISQQSFLSVHVGALSKEAEDIIDGLSSAFDAVALRLASLVAAKRSFKRGLAELLLTGQKRFAEFAQSSWTTATLGTLVAPISRRNRSGVKTVLSATGEHGLVDHRRYFNKSVSSEDISRYYLLKQGEFAYNRSAMRGYPFGATKRLDEYAQGALSTLYLCFGIKDERLNSDFLVHLFESGLLDRQLRRIARVGGRAHGLLNVTASDYFAITIPLPALEEQGRISRLLNDCASEIDQLERLQRQLAIYKRAIFARLLAGELAIPA